MTTAQMYAVGIIGTGEIGWRMGKLLLAAGYVVIGYDIRPEALRRPKESGFILADSVADLCQRAELVLTCVTDGTALRDVVIGPAGIAGNLAAGKPLIDTTSAEPWITRDLASILKQKGIPFLDAPVSGGVPAAEAGRMNFMVGGDAALIERCRPILERLGPVITHVGEIGSGHTVKAVNMLALAANMIATAELIAIGIQAGQSLNYLIERLDAGSGASYSTRVHFPRFIAPGNYELGFTFDLMKKDLSIGIGLAEQYNIPLFLQRSTYELYRAAANCGLGGKDNTRIVEALISNARASQTEKTGEDIVHRLELLAAACNTIIAAESICLGAAAGLSPVTIIDVLSASSGYSHALSRQVPAYLRGTIGDATPTLDEIWSAAATTMANVMAEIIPTPLLCQAVAIYAAAVARYQSQSDSRCVIDLIAEWTGQSGVLQRT